MESGFKGGLCGGYRYRYGIRGEKILNKRNVDTYLTYMSIRIHIYIRI